MLMSVPSPNLGRLKQGIKVGLQSALPHHLDRPARYNRIMTIYYQVNNDWHIICIDDKMII